MATWIKACRSGLRSRGHLHRPGAAARLHGALFGPGSLGADGRLTVWTSTQTPYIVQCHLASTLGLRENDVRVIKPAVGGLRRQDGAAFLGTVRRVPLPPHRPPVKFTRPGGEFILARRRHPMKLHSKVGFRRTARWWPRPADPAGRRRVQRLGPTATFLCGNFGACLPLPGLSVLGSPRLHQQASGQRMRGFGAPQSLFVSESQMNMAAEELGIDPIELRIRSHAHR